MQHVHEYIKLKSKLMADTSPDFESIAIKALENDAHRNNKVQMAENTKRRLIKTGLSAEGYKKKAREVYKYAKGFE
jgi:hypothetical protein